MKSDLKKLSGWGLFPKRESEVVSFNQKIFSGVNSGDGGFIARGFGRSYGDASIGYQKTISTQKLNRFLAFDEKKGILECESGVSLAEILLLVMPKGWFLPVTPGTKWVSLGGAVASDVHGKNHHLDGSLANWILSLKLLTAEGEVLFLKPEKGNKLFWATVGGMGLTGVILSVSIQLKKISSPRILQTQYLAQNLEDLFSLFEAHQTAPYSVAWIDTQARGRHSGRGILSIGEFEKKPNKLKVQDFLFKKVFFTFRFFLPSFLLNFWTLKCLNVLYFFLPRAYGKTKVVHFDPFFYPLDVFADWNLAYGSKGFVQYQCVFPLANSLVGVKKILTICQKNGLYSFVTVLKRFGKPSQGLLSFPIEGMTLCLDFPTSEKVLRVLKLLDEVVEEYGGKIYLAKDARLDGKLFAKLNPNLSAFQTIKKMFDPHSKLKSYLSKRLELSR
jgi:FAD/FMN-containing dehydrogenase